MFIPWNIIIPAMIFVIGSNALIYRLIIKQGEQRIKQYLESQGLSVFAIRRTGFFDTGDFKEPLISRISLFSGNGRMSSVHYRYLDFKDKNGIKRTVSVKIHWHLFKRTWVEFRPDVNKYAA